jgi:hypothetical protein
VIPSHSSTATDNLPPPGWERETPKYRATRDLRPAQKARYRSEPPFTSGSDIDIWQYGTKPIAAGDIIETKDWPGPGFYPLNYAAEKILAFFHSAMKSRLTCSPFDHAGRIRLDNGLSDAPAIFDVRPPQIKPVDLRPVS